VYAGHAARCGYTTRNRRSDIGSTSEELASFEHLTARKFVFAKLAEQFAGLDYLKQRAERAGAEKFRNALRYVSDVEPDEFDRL
jgi:hypothetical protein